MLNLKVNANFNNFDFDFAALSLYINYSQNLVVNNQQIAQQLMNFNPNNIKNVFDQRNKRQDYNQYNENSINSHSQSIGFTLFANSNRLQSYRLDYQNKDDIFTYPEPRDITIGFQNRQNLLFFEKSNAFSEHVKMQIKKPSTFQIITNYNIVGERNHQCMKQSDQDDLKHKNIGFQFGLRKKNQNKILGGNQSSLEDYPNQNDLQNYNNVKFKTERDCFWSDPNQYSMKKTIKNKQRRRFKKQDESDQSSLQNLKSIAKIVFNVIKQKKTTSYKELSKVLSQTYYEELQRQLQEEQLFEIQDKISNQKEVINKMIKNTTFSYISQIKKENVPVSKVKIQHEDLQKRIQKDKNLQEKVQISMKNIRRRLYDALNVMIASGIVSKKNKDVLSLNVINSYSTDKLSAQAMKNSCTYKQLQAKLAHKLETIEAKKKFRQSLIQKYLNVKNILARNKEIVSKFSVKSTKNQQKEQKQKPKQQLSINNRLFFPLILTSTQLPFQIEIGNNNQWATLDSNQKISLVSDLDALSYISWVQDDKVKQMQKIIEQKVSQKFSNFNYEIGAFLEKQQHQDQEYFYDQFTCKQQSQDDYIQKPKRQRNNQCNPKCHEISQSNKLFEKNKKVKESANSKQVNHAKSQIQLEKKKKVKFEIERSMLINKQDQQN